VVNIAHATDSRLAIPAGTETMSAPSNDSGYTTTKALILALMTEWTDFKEHGQIIESQILALADANGLPGVLPDPAG
jgi:hypothetical protein